MGNKKVCKAKVDPGVDATVLTDNNTLRRASTPEIRKKEYLPLQFHIPAGILAKIVSYVGAAGPDALKNWIRAGPEGKSAVYCKETLFRVSFYGHPLYILWSKKESPYFHFFSNCLEHKNPQALYVESIRLAFCSGDLDGALKITRRIKDDFPNATLLHIMLCSFAGVLEEKDFIKFKSQHKYLEEVQHVGDSLIFHVNCMDPRREYTYSETWRFPYFPKCFLDQEWFQEDNGERCLQCIYYYLSMQLCMLA